MTTKTVFVVGAGASKELGLPIGSELRDSIVNLFRNGDHSFLNGFSFAGSPGRRNYSTNSRDIAARVFQSLPLSTSIDEFIDEQADDAIEFAGKMAIVYTILKAERSSAAYIDQSRNGGLFDGSALRDTWYVELWRMIRTGCRTKEQIEKRLNSIAIVVFNYDRCVEHVLVSALRAYYTRALSYQDAERLVSSTEIHHVYGKCGDLVDISFGANLAPPQLADVAGELKTFTEGMDPATGQVRGIRKAIAGAKRIVFLGFSFNPRNMQVLRAQTSDDKNDVACFGSALGFSGPDQDVIRHRIRMQLGILPEAIRLEPVSCAGLMHMYSQSIQLD